MHGAYNVKQSNKSTLYKLLIRSILTYAVLACSSTCPSNYLEHPLIQLKCLRVIGNIIPDVLPPSHLHDTVNTEPIAVIIHRLTANFSLTAPPTPSRLVQQIGN
jgi:hypothetical protein